jgi:hypothetical protein
MRAWFGFADSNTIMLDYQFPVTCMIIPLCYVSPMNLNNIAEILTRWKQVEPLPTQLGTAQHSYASFHKPQKKMSWTEKMSALYSWPPNGLAAGVPDGCTSQHVALS